ncbi:VOC family protein [Dyadobacter sandarakinus]|uniref:VOC family protein n=1 Tax=Dyadobacter sandarakinus TaxID=2747268 RepID=A0ABX7IC91_9BACT|nr:VOC family protein [Dyadobacter sandarakinus]QRR03443.1 VOC family protein [Dyadobacter sandarakinus]
MDNVKIPVGHQQVMPYLIIDGAAAFLDFITVVFTAETLSIHHQDDAVLIRHAEVRIGESCIMFADKNETWPAQTGSLFIYVKNADDTYQLALENGATSVMEPADQSYGRSCGITDPAGNTWWITSVL